MTVTKLGAQAFAMALPFALVTSIGLRKVKERLIDHHRRLLGTCTGIDVPSHVFNQLAGSVLSEGLALILF